MMDCGDDVYDPANPTEVGDYIPVIILNDTCCFSLHSYVFSSQQTLTFM